MWLGMVALPLIPVLRRKRQKDLCEFETSQAKKEGRKTRDRGRKGGGKRERKLNKHNW